MERVAGPVDDGLEQLVPRPRGRGEAQDLVEEAQLVELVAGRRRAPGVGRGLAGRRGVAGTRSGRRAGAIGHHLTSVGKVMASKGCDAGKGCEPLRSARLGRHERPRAAHDLERRCAPSRPGSGRPARATRSPREVRLLGALLGQVIVEQAGPDLFELVERVRRPDDRAAPATTIPTSGARLDADLDGLDLGSAEAVIESFALYFQLVNLAEARGRVRTLRRRERAARDGVLDDSVAEAVGRAARGGADDGRLDELLGGLSDRAWS